MAALRALLRAFARGEPTRTEVAPAKPEVQATLVSSTSLQPLVPPHRGTTVATHWTAPATGAHLDTIAPPTEHHRAPVLKVSTRQTVLPAPHARLVSIVQMRPQVAARPALLPPT